MNTKRIRLPSAFPIVSWSFGGGYTGFCWEIKNTSNFPLSAVTLFTYCKAECTCPVLIDSRKYDFKLSNRLYWQRRPFRTLCLAWLCNFLVFIVWGGITDGRLSPVKIFSHIFHFTLLSKQRRQTTKRKDVEGWARKREDFGIHSSNQLEESVMVLAGKS